MDGYDYIYMSNGKVVVVRDPATFAYSETTDLPTASSIVNFNGQAIIGAPDTLLPGVDITIESTPIELNLDLGGYYTTDISISGLLLESGDGLLLLEDSTPLLLET